MIDSTFERCETSRRFVLLDQTHEQCSDENQCDGQHCPLKRLFSEAESSPAA